MKFFTSSWVLKISARLLIRFASLYFMALITCFTFVIESAHRAKIPVAMCGEMAGDPYATILLIGFGLDKLSVTPDSIP
ncbi:putative PEP-binding protein, partial [Candidatus Kryptobacter tengchongensis]|uniref:putative PEP-binding protein n=1 Tax=Kryptobacter tengchongensis TaxID=1643429 RepID=UPI002A4E20BA